MRPTKPKSIPRDPVFALKRLLNYPETLNPEAPNPETLNPETLNPTSYQTLNPETLIYNACFDEEHIGAREQKVGA